MAMGIDPRGGSSGKRMPLDLMPGAVPIPVRAERSMNHTRRPE
jgi:hypothetical protein